MTDKKCILPKQCRMVTKCKSCVGCGFNMTEAARRKNIIYTTGLTKYENGILRLRLVKEYGH